MFTISDVRKQLKIMGFKDHIPDSVLQSYITKLAAEGFEGEVRDEGDGKEASESAFAKQDSSDYNDDDDDDEDGEATPSSDVEGEEEEEDEEKGEVDEDEGDFFGMSSGLDKKQQYSSLGIRSIFIQDRKTPARKSPGGSGKKNRLKASPRRVPLKRISQNMGRKSTPRIGRIFSRKELTTPSPRSRPVSTRTSSSVGSARKWMPPKYNSIAKVSWNRVPISKVGQAKKKCDPVSRYHQYKNAWDSNRFLSKKKKTPRKQWS